MGTYSQELQAQFDTAQRDLARNDLDRQALESKLNQAERYTLEWYHILEDLNNNERKRQLIASRLASIRIEIQKVSPQLSVKRKF